MTCRFCNASSTDSPACSFCQVLIEDEDWHVLAKLWLTCRPQDWTGDVAAFLELTEGPGANPPRWTPLADASLSLSQPTGSSRPSLRSATSCSVTAAT